MNNLLTLLVLCLLCGTIACKKSNNSGPAVSALPPVTDTGANTFGCLVDGELFLPAPEKGSWIAPITCYYQEVSRRLIFLLDATNGKTSKGFIFNIDGILLKDTVLKYQFYTKDEPAVLARYGSIPGPEYATYNNCPGEFRLTRFDYIKGIASGTFWFDVVDTVARDTVHIREGRFDVNF